MDRMNGEPKDRIEWGVVICTVVATLILACLVYLTAHPGVKDLEPFHPYIAPALVVSLLLMSASGWHTHDV